MGIKKFQQSKIARQRHNLKNNLLNMKYYFFWFLLFLGLILNSRSLAANSDLTLNDSLSVSLRIALQLHPVNLGEKPKKKRSLKSIKNWYFGGFWGRTIKNMVFFGRSHGRSWQRYQISKYRLGDFIGINNDVGLTISAQTIDDMQKAPWFLSIPDIIRPDIKGLSGKRIFLSEETLGRLVVREPVVKSVTGTSRIFSFAGLYASVWWTEGALYSGLSGALNEIEALRNVRGIAAKSVATLFSKNGTLFNQAAGISFGFESTLFMGGRNFRVKWGSFFLEGKYRYERLLFTDLTYGSPILKDLILSGTAPKDILIKNGVPSVVAGPLSSLVFKDGLVLPIFGSPPVPVLKGNRHSLIGRLGTSYAIKGYDKIEKDRFKVYGDFWIECLLSRESSRHFWNKQSPKLVGIKYNLNIGLSLAFWTAE